jgi:hypothetical protein
LATSCCRCSILRRTTNALTITNPTPNWETDYRCVATNDCGSDESGEATLTIDNYFGASIVSDNPDDVCGLLYTGLEGLIREQRILALFGQCLPEQVQPLLVSLICHNQRDYVGPGAYGTKTFTWTITNGLCVSSADVDITFNEPPVMDCPDDMTVCNNVAPFALTATPPGGTYTGSPGIVGTTFDPSQAPPGLNTITYTVTDINTGCTNSCSFNITVLSSPPNTIHQPGDGPYTFCALNGTLAAKNPPGGVTGLWTYTAMSGTLSFGNASAYNSSVTASQYGTYTLFWTTTGANGCTTTKSTTATFSAPPTVTCPGNAEYCETEPGFTLTGGSPLGGVYTQNNIPQTTFNPFTEGVGVHTIVYKVTDGNGCTGTCSFTITVFDQAEVEAGLPQVICAGVDVTVSGTIGGGATMSTWTSSGDGMFANPTALSTTYTPGTGDLTFGSATLILTTNDPAGPCNLVADNFLVTINPAPNADAGNDDVVCALVYQLNANPSPGASGIWTTSDDVIFADETDPNTMVTANDYGTYTFTWTETIGDCTDADDVTITFNLAPEVTCPGPINICINTPPIDLTDGMPSGGTYTGPGVSMNTFDPAVAGAGTHTITYAYTAGNGCSGSCEFNINVFTVPTANAGPDAATCGWSMHCKGMIHPLVLVHGHKFLVLVPLGLLLLPLIQMQPLPYLNWSVHFPLGCHEWAVFCKQ